LEKKFVEANLRAEKSSVEKTHACFPGKINEDHALRRQKKSGGGQRIQWDRAREERSREPGVESPFQSIRLAGDLRLERGDYETLNRGGHGINSTGRGSC